VLYFLTCTFTLNGHKNPTNPTSGGLGITPCSSTIPPLHRSGFISHAPHPFAYSPIHPFAHSPIHPFTHSPIHPFTHSPMHPARHPSTRTSTINTEYPRTTVTTGFHPESSNSSTQTRVLSKVSQELGLELGLRVYAGFIHTMAANSRLNLIHPPHPPRPIRIRPVKLHIT
jgi:hypothetical protein